MKLDAGNNLTARKSLTSSGGKLNATAGNNIEFGGHAYSADTMNLDAGNNIKADKSVKTGGKLNAEADWNIEIAGDVESTDNMNLDAGNKIEISNKITSGGKLTALADNKIIFHRWAHSEDDMKLDAGDDVYAHGDLISNNGSVEIYSSDDTTYLGGDVFAAVDVLLNNNTRFIGFGDQRVTAETGMITANGYLRKLNCGSSGSLYLQANGDISLANYVKAAYCCPVTCASRGGGVSIISETGKIFTPDEFGDPTDTLNVAITGRSVDAALLEGEEGIGVDLPYGPGKAAILIMSAEDLKLGTDAELIACGRYDSELVDDRAGIDFLVEDVLPGLPLPDGWPDGSGIPRDAGEPFDLAIYVASTTGDVDVSSPVSILSSEPVGEEEYECVPKGAMVIDAYDTVTFGAPGPDTPFETSLANGEVGDRLEVCSRISEWLDDAWNGGINPRLPYIFGGGPWPDGYNYVLRGENPDGIGAWVLEWKPAPTAALPLLQIPRIEGCPVEMEAAAMELGITGETIQVGIGNALALNPSIQPCEACATLIDAAAILRDEDGSRMAAMVQVFDALAPADAPFTPEMATSIATAFGTAAEGTLYASVAEYIDAFVQYVAVLDVDLGSPVGDGDSVAFVMEKYGAGVTGSDNANIGAFVATRLEGLETFGD